jgi:biopolymer transport protein ExbD
MRFLSGRPRKPSIEISSLVDVMFLLIIFFTVSTTFKEGAGLPITLPSAGSSSAQARGPVEVTVSDQGQIELGGTVYPSLTAAEADLRSAIESADPRTVTIRGDRKTAYETIIQVLDLAREMEVKGVSLSTAAPRGASSSGSAKEQP